MELSLATDVKLYIKTTTSVDLHPFTSHVDTDTLRWNCSLQKIDVRTTISLWPSSKDNRGVAQIHLFRHIKSLRVFNNHGDQVAGNAVNNYPVFDKTFFGLVETKCIRVGYGLEFNIVLSKDEFVAPRAQSVIVQPTLWIPKVIATLMKDIATQDFAFTFGLNGSARNIGLWAHQSVLAHQPVLAALIRKLKVVEGSCSDSDVAAGIKSHHITDYSLESYCCLIRFLYCGVIELKVDLDDFGIGCPPNKPFSPSCKNRSEVYRKFTSGSSLSSSTDPNLEEQAEPQRVATWDELFQVADCYQVTKLRQFCLDKIKEALDIATVLDVLYGFAYRYPDLKTFVLEFVAMSMDDLYASSSDPFAPYASHPQRHELLSEALSLMFKAKAQIRNRE